ncbi:MAG TPA: FecR domain-containing protein [Pyrinomonadaceae bacterium]
MENKYRKFYVEWWKVRKSTIYGIAAFVVVTSAVGYGVWWGMHYDWFAQQATAEVGKDAARIISFEGDVRITRAATRETILVTKETYVAAGDTIQTQADGRAVVQMIDQSVYSVRPNSTVVIRDSSSIFGGTNVRVALDDGQINVRTDQQPENTENVVEMMDSETQLRSQTDASFNADAYSGGGEIRISRGSVETTVGGERATINANEFASVSDGRIASREKLLLPPKQATPANMSQVLDASGRGVTMSFAWQDESSLPVASYYIQIARSPYFSPDSMLVDRGSVTSREFRLAGLVPGTYYWRLKTTSRAGQTSDWNDPWRFNVVKRESNPAIEVANWSVEKVGGNVFIITGQTRAGLYVRSQGRQTFVGGDGIFRMQVSTPLSEVAIELGDESGNRGGFVLSLRNAKVLRRF